MSRGSVGPARGFISELDGLRGVAILLVMVHRFWPRTGVGVAADAAGAGWIGVDLFFVISGFLITGILLDTRGERAYFKNFYARRVLRIFPLYYLFVIGVLIAFSGNPEFRQHSGSPLWYLFHLGNVPEGLLDKDVPYWLAPVWSLAIEEQFYLTFPLLVWLLDRRKLTYLLIAMIVAAPVIRAATMFAAPDQERIQYLFTLCRVDTLAIGCLLAVVVRAIDIERWRATGTKLAIAGLSGATVISIATALDRTTWFGRVLGYSVVAVGCASVVALVVLWRGAAVTGLFRVPALTYLGKLCFGLYLLHRPADTFVSAAADRLGVDADLWILPIKVAVAVAFATVSWRFFEQRFLRLKDLFTSDRHPVVARAVTVTLVLLLAIAGCRSGAPTSADVDQPDARDPDAAIDGGSPDPDAAVAPRRTVLYPEDLRHSPLPASLVDHLHDIAGIVAHDDQVFAKVGDSITSADAFLDCFDGDSVDLGAAGGLAPTLAYYQQGDAAGTSPFSRTSYAAVGGTTARDALTGSPCTLERELDTIDPRLAIVMFGTNDVRYGRTADAFGADLWTIIDLSIARGTIPILSTIPPLNGDPGTDARIPLFNRIIRAIAQGRGIPLVDLHAQLRGLPDRGLATDNLHPSTSPAGACALDDAGLQYGYNVRNLLTLEALDRVRGALAGTAADATAPTRSGTGLGSDPFIATLPLVDLGDTRNGEATLDNYECTGRAQGGHEIVYRLELAAATTLDAHVVDRGGVDVDVHILSGGLAATSCIGAGDASATATVGPGVVYIVVDTPVAAGEGEYLLSVAAR